MTRSKIGNRGTVQCEWGANEGRDPLGGGRKVPQPDRKELKGHTIWRRPSRFRSTRLRPWFNREIYKLPRRSRRELTRGFSDERGPQESRRRELRTVRSMHRSKLKSDQRFRIALDQKLQLFRPEAAMATMSGCTFIAGLGCLRLNRLFTRLIRQQAGHRVDPTETIVDGFHAGHVFRGRDQCLPLAFFGKHAPQFD